MTNVDEIIDKFAKCHDNKVAIAFTKSIGELLKLNGVTAHYTECNSDAMTEDEISKQYGIVFDSLDFTEHDKGFKDEIKRLKESIKERDSYINQLKHELEEKCSFETDRLVKLTFNPLETANMLINATYKVENTFLKKQVDRNVYDIDDLEQIAEHLLVYCKHNNIEEE